MDEVPFKYERALIYCDGDRGVSSGDTQNLPVCGSVQCALDDPAW